MIEYIALGFVIGAGMILYFDRIKGQEIKSSEYQDAIDKEMKQIV